MSSSLHCLSKNSFFTTSAKACCKNEPKIETMGLSWAPKLNHVVSIILHRLMNLMILSCGLPLQWDLKLAEVFLTSVYFACDKIHWPDICDVINDSESWGSYLKNHKRFSIVSERVIWVADGWKPKGAITAKESITLLFLISEKKRKQWKPREICIHLVRKRFYDKQPKFTLLTKGTIRRLNKNSRK